MKSRRLIVVAFLALEVMAGCGTAELPQADSSAAGANKSTALEDANVPAGCVSLTADELNWFQNSFFGGTAGHFDWSIHRVQFLTSYYDNATEINLAELLYCGGPENGNISEEEAKLIKFPNAVSWQKYTVKGIDAFLFENSGITLSDCAGNGLDELTYFPDYDAYYSCRSDVNCGPITISTGWQNWDSGLITIVYNETQEVILQRQDNGR